LAPLKASLRSPITVSLLPHAAAGDGDDPLALLGRPSSSGRDEQCAYGNNFGCANSLVGGAALLGVRQFYLLIRRPVVNSRCRDHAPSDHSRRETRWRVSRQGSIDGRCRSDLGSTRISLPRDMWREVLRLLDEITFHQAIVFCNQPAHAMRLVSLLCAAGFPTAFISGAHTQDHRSTAIRKMRSFHLRVLVTTDLLARGVDFGHVTLVLQLGPPRDLATYIHRVGRTGRFGTLGLALVLLHDEDLPEMQALLSQLRVAVPPLPHALPESAYLEQFWRSRFVGSPLRSAGLGGITR